MRSTEVYVVRFPSVASALSVIIILCGLPAQTETIIGNSVVRALPGGTVIEISGPLIGPMGNRLRAAMDQAPGTRLVRLDSAGGVIAVAIEIQNAIRAGGLETEARGECNSACTIAFLGGSKRFATNGTRFGFHRASNADQSLGVADLIVRGLYLHAGVAEGFVDRVLDTPHEQMWFPAMAEMVKAGFVNAMAGPTR